MKNLVSKIIRFEKKNPQYKKTITIMYCLLYVLQRVTDFMDSFIRQVQRIILKKQIVSLVLTLILVISMITQPISVYATDTTTRNTSPSNETNGDIPIDAEHFPDDVFREYILNDVSINTNGDKILSSAEINSATDIEILFKKDIKSLKGLEYFTALKTLYCDGTGITELDISKNVALEELSCGSVGIREVDISKNTALKVISFSGTQIEELDISQNTKLKKLWCYNTGISQLDVSKNFDLEALYCDRTNLESLNVNKNQNLKVLTCYQTGIETLDVTQNTNLKQLDCHNTKIKSLDVSKNTELQELSCYSTKIESLDVSKNTDLTKLNCSMTEIENLDISKNSKLKELECYSIAIEKLDVTQNINLEDLSCYSTKIQSLNVTHNLSLRVLDCSDTAIEKLDVTKNTNLEQLWCSSTKIQSLNVIQNLMLKVLDFSGTAIEQLDVTQNINLENLYCYNTKIESLDVSKNSKLRELLCYNTSLVYLDIGNISSLKKIQMPTLSSIELKEKNSTFNIADKFPGIDPQKINVTKGAKYDSNTGIVSEYLDRTPIEYSYDCGTADGKAITLNVKLTILQKEESTIKITTNDLNKTYDGKPVITPNVEKTGSSKAITYIWKKWNDQTFEWDEIPSAPTEAGEYEFHAHVDADDNYIAAEDYVYFDIDKADGSIAIETIDGKTYDGNDFNHAPAIKEKTGTGNVTYTWEMKKGNDWEEIESIPKNAGEYRVTAILEADDNYKSAKSEPVEFEISQASNSWKKALSIDNWTYKEEAKEPSSEAKFGEVTYTYSKKGLNQYSTTVPTTAGDWTVRATVVGTDNYKGMEATKDFTIYKAIALAITEPQNLSGVQDDKLSTVTLPEYWSWVDKDTVLKATNNGYKARLTVDDANYDYTGVAGYSEGNHYVERTLKVVVPKVENEWTVDPSIENWTYNETASTPVGTAKHGTVIFTYSSSKDVEFTKNKPTTAGTWYMKAYVSADDEYKELIKVIEFKILKAENSGLKIISTSEELTTDYTGKTYDKTPKISKPDNYTGTVTFKWEKKKADGSWEELLSKPTDTGTYQVSAIASEDNNYQKTESEPVQLEIRKAESTITVKGTLDKAYDSNSVSNPTIDRTGSSKTPVYTWEKKNGNDWEKLESAPKDVGEYRVKIDVAEDDNHKSATATKEFTISQATNSWKDELQIENWIYGEEAKKPSSKAKFGEVTYTYSKKGLNQYTTTVPTTAGDWTVKATVEETDNYKEIEATVDFKINKVNGKISITSSQQDLKSIYNGQPFNKTVNVEKPVSYTGTVTFKWEKQMNNSWEVLTDKPKDAGTYRVTAIASADNNYKEALSEPVQFEIEKAEAPIITEPKNLSGGEGQKLSTVALSNGWKWLKDDTVLTADQTKYQAYLEVDDSNYDYANTDGYNESKHYVVRALTIIIKAQNEWKVSPSIENWTYGKEANKPNAEAKFGEVKYTYSDKKDGVFTDKIPTDAGTWYVKAQINETSNYTGLEEVRGFNIDKAEPVYTLPVNLNAVYGQTLGEIALNDGFEWVEPLKKVGDAGDVTAMLRYTPDDSNYKTVTIPVVIKVNRAENEWIHHPSIENWIYGEEAKEPTSEAKFGEVEYTYSDKKDGVFTDKVPTDTGTWYVKAQVNETGNYTGLEEVKEFNINKAIPTVELPTNLKGVEEQLLSTVVLPKGWTWTDGDIMLSVQNSGYKARLIVDDINYDYTGVEGYNKENHYVERTLNVSVASKEAGSIQKEVKKGNNAPDVKIPMTESQLANIVLTDDEKKAVEKGSDIKIVLTVDDASGQISIKDKTVVESVLGEMKIGQYLDVSLLKIIDHEESRISQTRGIIRITIEIPESLRKANREFVMIRVHDGVATILKDLDTDANTITIETDQFSTYAIAYQDKQSNIAETEDRTVIGGYIILAGLSGMLLFINRKQKRI
ncbi:leucine-rich repeat domain-containing protein [Candidatus Stoquefichus sp. SB1]|uniref:leucine-rich repeat domain-containing protein n=1 Tax=Candidatus Stoquefichus sp. SB1 TaxID=1658109 RepID=UPI00067EB6FA|nr:MBG domain-containing protein [Candidatus Stoquefichus sp. SB1]